MHDFLETAKLAVQLQAEVIRAAFLAEKRITQKADTSLVTETDQAAEATIRAFIQSRHPDHEILGEESGTTGEKGQYHWTIDPIDGTTNFTRGIPAFTTAVALLQDGKPLVAAAHEPVTGDLYAAERDKGATLNGIVLTIEKAGPLDQAVVAFGRTRQQKPAFQRVFDRIHPLVGTLRIVGSIIVGNCLVAAGRLNAAVVLSPSLWDLAPGILIAQEAGAVALNFSGQPWQPGEAELILAHPNLARAIVEVLKTR